MITLDTGKVLSGVCGTTTAVTYTIFGCELNTSTTAESYKVLSQGQLPTSIGTLYTTPGTTSTFIKSIHLSNTTSSTVTGITLTVGGTAAANQLISSRTIPAYGTATFDQNGWQTYDQGGKLLTTVSPLSGVFTIINVKDYGATGDSSTDDTTAIQAALNAAALGQGGRGVSLYFPDGIYKTTSTLTVTQSNITLLGAGRGSTVIYPTSTTTDAIKFGTGSPALATLCLRDMQIFFPSQQTAGAAINVNNCSDVLIENFSISNPFIGVLIQGASIKVSVRNGTINGTNPVTGHGIQVNNGLAGDTYITDIVMSNGTPPASGINLIVTGHTSILRCNITKATTGLLINPTSAASSDVSYVFIDHSLFDSCSSAALYINPAASANARVRSIACSNSWFSGTTAGADPLGSGIVIGGGAGAVIDDLKFQGCRILNNYNHGVAWTNAAATNVSFIGCSIVGNSTSSSNTKDGINIAANCSGTIVIGCEIGQSGTAGATQRYGLNIAAGSSGNLKFIGNDFGGNQTAPYILMGALTGTGNVFRDNYPCLMMVGGLAAYSGTGLAQNGSEAQTLGVTLPANACRVGTSFRIRGYGTITSTVANAINIRVRLNGTSLGGTAPVTFSATGTTTASSAPFNIDAIVTVRTLGGPGTTTGSGVALTNLTAGSTQAWATNYILFATVGACTPTTTGTLVLELTTQTAASSTTITWQQVIIECVNP